MKRDREAVDGKPKRVGTRKQNSVLAKVQKVRDKWGGKRESLVSMVWRCKKDMRVYAGQGTTEYAIIVGVSTLLG